MPSLLTAGDPFDEDDTARIIEHEFCRLKVDIVLALVDFVFRFVPFNPQHNYRIVHTDMYCHRCMYNRQRQGGQRVLKRENGAEVADRGRFRGAYEVGVNGTVAIR